MVCPACADKNWNAAKQANGQWVPVEPCTHKPAAAKPNSAAPRKVEEKKAPSKEEEIKKVLDAFGQAIKKFFS